MKNKIAPTLLIYAKDDDKFVDGGIAYEKAMKATGNPVRMLLYEKGGHGMKNVNWYPESHKWLMELGINISEKQK